MYTIPTKRGFAHDFRWLPQAERYSRLEGRGTFPVTLRRDKERGWFPLQSESTCLREDCAKVANGDSRNASADVNKKDFRSRVEETIEKRGRFPLQNELPNRWHGQRCEERVVSAVYHDQRQLRQFYERGRRYRTSSVVNWFSKVVFREGGLKEDA